MRTRFSSVAALVKERIYGSEPVGAAQARVLLTGIGAELSGRMGTPHFGMHGEPNQSFTGLAASPQGFQGVAQMGSSPSVTVQAYPALPNDQPPPALPSWFNDWTATEGMA